MVGECGYCGQRRALTEEHVIPQWLEKLCDARGEYQQVVGNSLIPSGNKRSARCVCVECHRWINHTYEEPVQPIISPLVLGQARVISSAEQAVIAGWAEKVALGMGMIDWGVRRVRHLSNPFRRLGVPTSRTFVALGAVPPVLNPGNVQWPDHPVTKEEPVYEAPRLEPGGVQHTFQAVHLIMLVIHTATNSERQRVTKAYRLYPSLIRIWPSTGENVTWPPPGWFDEPLHIAFRALNDWPEVVSDGPEVG